MPFQVECLFCGHRAQVPDRAYGASGTCPKCANSFTLVPAAVTVPLPASGKSSRKESHTSSRKESHNRTLAKTAPTPITDNPASPTPVLETELPAPAPRPKRKSRRMEKAIAAAAETLPDAKPTRPPRRIDPLSLVALLTGGAALLCASAPALCGFVLPLGAVAVLLGLASFLLAPVTARVLLPATATALGAGVTVAALFFPALLGPMFRAAWERGRVDPTAIRIIPLAGEVGTADPEWVDASRAALEQGRVRVEVVSASVGPDKAKSAAPKKGPPPECLFVRLRTRRVEKPGEFAQRKDKTGQRLERPRPRLTDAAGKVYEPREVVEAAPEKRKTDKRSGLFPVTVQEEEFVFEAPPASASLRLEIAAATWGGTGAFRFTIPGSMIRHEGGPASPSGVSGGK
jgi:hypothetical protein